ncbi:hypothetical protein [Nocardia salmonicida]|uniref:hypothetical protein n=1 Tax=Nocardia salmonicida TaxID=53431 RepID=UPI003787CDE6
MTIHRDGQWLVATRTEHVACEHEQGMYRLSLLPQQLVTASQALAGLAIAEIVDQWGPLLWETNPNTSMVWKLIGMHARTLGLDALDAVIRVQQSEWPMTAAERAEWTR